LPEAGGSATVSTLSNLAPGPEKAGVATVCHFPRLAHEDGPDLISRISVELLRSNVDPDSKAFKQNLSCIKHHNASQTSCEEKLGKEIAREQKPSKTEPVSNDSSKWWNTGK
jgi:hypothetical protein